ncbi:TEX14 kinase, partial [Pseudoatta argentina]
ISLLIFVFLPRLILTLNTDKPISKISTKWLSRYTTLFREYPCAMKKLLSFRWIKKTTTRSDRDVQSTSPMPQDGRNEYCRNLLQQFANHCQTSNGEITDPDWVVYLSKEQNAEQSALKDNRKLEIHGHFIPGVPHIRAAEIFEIGCIAGTENKCLELVSAEWNNTKVTLKRHVLSTCRDAIKADVEILNEIRHPNILLLMATTYTSEHGLVSIFESIDCSLYNYMHEQGERINVQGIMQIGIKLADALKYCHMRGYIHTAISSHCVYFATDTTVKLGGWELAREMKKTYVEHDFEKYLRLENFKWQAPAICYRLQPNKKIDVYCLMLLLWEMCTGNLLEAGLHPDETMIMLDMDRIGKKLHRLLMIYEEEEKNDTFINENRNNNDLLYNDTLYQKTSSMSLTQNKILTKKPFTGQSYQPTGEKKSMSNQLLKSKKEQCNGDLDSKNNMKKMTVINDSVVSPMIKVKTTTPCTRCAEISNIVQDLDERNDARANIKRLKKLIASRREDFFFGSDSTFSYSTSYPKATSSLLSQEKSPDYVPCKPANHTTAIEPKCNKSPSEYSGAISKLCTPRRKAPYMGMPSSIKYAIMQPQVLHSNAKSFYESTLWRKEKEICLSRMGRNSKEHKRSIHVSKFVILNINIKLYNFPFLNKLFIIIKDNCTEDDKKSLKNVSNGTSANISITSNQSIQNLKDALDRATEIISSTTSSKVDLNNIHECKAVFENLYGTRYNDNHEIKVIEKSTSSNRSFLDLSMDEVKNIKTVNEAAGKQIFNQAFIDSQTISSTTTKTSIESETSQNQSTKKTDQSKITFTNRNTSTPQKIRVDEREYVNIRPLSSVILKDSPRRRSLPAKLNNLATYASPRIVLNKKNIQGNQYTTEDMYIDDEFGSKLNYNLILLNDNIILSDDDESLPQTTEL